MASQQRLLFIIRDKDQTFWSDTGTHGAFHPELRKARFFENSEDCDMALRTIRERHPKESFTIADLDIDLTSVYDARVHPQQ
ncbi:MAG: hypothetical protein GVY11_07450 [Gammaproteobacteria bacterium]|jgi:hypothetical protein|nr:hypothetical protein [Gammaproteobacteria bacterium]